MMTSGALVVFVIESLVEVDDLLGRHSPVELLDNMDLVCWDLFIDDNSVPSESSAQFTKCSPVLVVASYFHRVLALCFTPYGSHFYPPVTHCCLFYLSNDRYSNQ